MTRRRLPVVIIAGALAAVFAWRLAALDFVRFDVCYLDSDGGGWDFARDPQRRRWSVVIAEIVRFEDPGIRYRGQPCSILITRTARIYVVGDLDTVEAAVQRAKAAD